MSIDYERMVLERAFRESLDDLQFTPEAKERIGAGLVRAQDATRTQRKGTGGTMKRKRTIGVAAVAFACFMAFGGMAIASGHLASISGHSNAGYDYTSIEQADDALREAGLDAAIPAQLAGGFEFDGITVVSNEAADEDGADMGAWKSLMTTYRNADGAKVSLTVEPENASIGFTPTEKQAIDGVEVGYSHDETYFVPADYEVDEATLARADSDPHFYVSYGSDEPETVPFDFAEFKLGGISYQLYSDDDLDSAALYAMAESIISQA